MTRALVAFPGRGAYTPSSLGSLVPEHPWVMRADDLRREAGRPALSELDGAGSFDPAVHLRPTNAWPLIFLAGLLDAERIADDHEVVAVVASSTGWYTALAAAGALPFDDALQLVGAMAAAAETPLPDGTRPADLIYPLADAAWMPDPELRRHIDEAVTTSDGELELALDLGAFAVLSGTSEAVEGAAGKLPPVDLADRPYPLRLGGGDAWHTSLRTAAVADAIAALPDLAWRQPNVAIVDGHGRRHTPFSSVPAAIAEHTLREQPVTTYDFATSLRVALREYAPDVILLPGPGSSLGAACAQLVVREGYRGVRSRADLEAAQRSANPILLSMRR
jgi:hypothetical protein